MQVQSRRLSLPRPTLERVLRLAAEIPAAILVVAEIVVLFAGVLARYVFATPLVWSDELASILFLWLAMLGSVIALQRSEHMRLTAVVAGFGHAARGRAEAVVVAAVALFLLLILPAAWDYAADQWYIETPALGLHDTFRVAALVVGAAMMLLTAFARLLRLGVERRGVRSARDRRARRRSARRSPGTEGHRQLEPRVVLRAAARRRRAAVACRSVSPSAWPRLPISRH